MDYHMHMDYHTDPNDTDDAKDTGVRRRAVIAGCF
jgi:hypothetical protein